MENIWVHTTQCRLQKGDTLRDDGPRLAPFVRRADRGFGVPPLAYGMPTPATIAVHFLYPQLRRKTLIERKLAQARTGTLLSERRPVAATPSPRKTSRCGLPSYGNPAENTEHTTAQSTRLSVGPPLPPAPDRS